MYIEDKSESLNGEAWIGRVSFNKTGRTLTWKERRFRKVHGGYKYNCVELGTGRHFWISGCKKGGGDRLYVSGIPIHIDEDVREEYWTTIRQFPSHKSRATC